MQVWLKVWQGHEVPIPAPAKGFPPSKGREEGLENYKIGNMDGGRTGVSLKEPLRTPIQLPPKNNTKTKITKKNYKISKYQKNHKTEKP